jgi:hypothetical protein
MHTYTEEQIKANIAVVAAKLVELTGGVARRRHNHSTEIALEHPELNAGQWLSVRYNSYERNSANGIKVDYSPGYGVGRSRTYTKLTHANLKKIAKTFKENYEMKVLWELERREKHLARMDRKARRTDLLKRIIQEGDKVEESGYSERTDIENLGVSIYHETQRDKMKVMFTGSETEVALILNAIRDIKHLDS